MKRGWRGWLRMLHRDVGYFLAGLILIYCISGIALNHRNDWDHSFVVERKTISFPLPDDRSVIDRDWVIGHLHAIGIDDHYRTHDFPSPDKMKVFFTEGSLLVDAMEGKGEYETLRRRPLFYQANLLHLNPNRWWTFFSDVFCLGLITVTLSGLFLTRGKFGFRWRGAILVGLGFLPPLGFLLVLG